MELLHIGLSRLAYDFRRFRLIHNRSALASLATSGERPKIGVHRVATERAGDFNANPTNFALLKRGHYGSFHQLSKKHLHRYVNEFAFRWNHRKTSDGERMVAAILGAEGKRLLYKQSCA